MRTVMPFCITGKSDLYICRNAQAQGTGFAGTWKANFMPLNGAIKAQ